MILILYLCSLNYTQGFHHEKVVDVHIPFMHSLELCCPTPQQLPHAVIEHSKCGSSELRCVCKYKIHTKL